VIHPLAPESPEWVAAWAALANDTVNDGLPDPSIARDEESGATWCYVGPTDTGHAFEHRCHPRTAARVVIVIAA
jgi:hypothetical protein